MITKSCICCAKDFEVDDSKRNWQHKELCSDECQRMQTNNKSRNKYKPIQWPQKKICLNCHAAFLVHEGGNMAQKYCGVNCQLAVKADRHLRIAEAKRITKQCPECGIAFIPSKYVSHKQKFCSDLCRSKSRNKQQYISGADGAKRRNQYKYDFKRIRPQVLERDNHQCVICSSSDKLHAHHWDNSGGSEHVNNVLENLGTLCDTCHYAIHGITLVRIDGKWQLDSKIFALLGLTGAIPIKP